MSTIESSARIITTKQVWSYFAEFFKKQTLGLIAVAVLLLVSTALMAAFPYFTGYIVDNAIKPGDKNILSFYAQMLVFFLLGILAVKAINFYLIQKLSQNVLYEIRVSIFKKIISIKIPFFDTTSTGAIITRLINDVDGIAELLSFETIEVLVDAVQILVIFVAMFNLDSTLAGIIFLFLPVIILTTAFYIKRALTYFLDASEYSSIMTGFLAEVIGGITSIQNFNAEEKFEKQFNEIMMKFLHAKRKSLRLLFSFWPLNTCYEGIIMITIMTYGVHAISQGSCTVGTLVAFLAYLRFLFGPLHHICDTATNIQASISNTKRIIGLLEQQEEPCETNLNHLSGLKGKIEFRDVWFSYSENTEWVLKGVSFIVEPGKECAIVGATGAGKTTIMNLIMKFYTPQKGEILIDDIPLSNISRESIRKSAAYVLQDPHLFSRSFADNITFFEPPDLEKTKHVLSLCGLHPVLDKFSDGIHTELLEQGSNLSTGEKQLLSFARALYADPSIIFLDEATANVDLQTERIIQASIKRLVRGKTSLVIAHRLSTILDSDQIIVLQCGSVTESGTHVELLAKNGEYSKLYQSQFEKSH